MKYLWPLLLLGSVHAAPLVGNNDPVLNSNFCRAYACVFQNSKQLDDKHLVTYRTNGPSLIILQNKGTILKANLKFTEDQIPNLAVKGQQIHDFIREFMNAELSMKTLSACRMMAEGDAPGFIIFTTATTQVKLGCMFLYNVDGLTKSVILGTL